MKDYAYERSEKVKRFLEEVEELCRKHGLSISHEDDQGGFLIERFSVQNLSWLNAAAEEKGLS